MHHESHVERGGGQQIGDRHRIKRHRDALGQAIGAGHLLRQFAPQRGQAFTHFIREAAGTSPADEISKAKALLADGTISQAEFDKLKAKALSA